MQPAYAACCSLLPPCLQPVAAAVAVAWRCSCMQPAAACLQPVLSTACACCLQLVDAACLQPADAAVRSLLPPCLQPYLGKHGQMPLAFWVHLTFLSHRLDVQGALLSAAPAGFSVACLTRQAWANALRLLGAPYVAEPPPDVQGALLSAAPAGFSVACWLYQVAFPSWHLC